MKDVFKLKKLISKLNNPRKGSFGEFIFENVIKENPINSISRFHRNRTDFVLNGENIDVKTSTQNIAIQRGDLREFKGNKIEGVKYSKVDFWLEGAEVSIGNIKLKFLKWKKISALFDKWLNSHRAPAGVPQPNANKMKWGMIKDNIVEYFCKKGINARCIYRTCESLFGDKESPDNLIPRIRNENAVEIYISFNNEVDIEDIGYIVCFPHIAIDYLPRLKKVWLTSGKDLKDIDKIDLRKITKKYKFIDIADLKQNYRRVYSREKG